MSLRSASMVPFGGTEDCGLRGGSPQSAVPSPGLSTALVHDPPDLPLRVGGDVERPIGTDRDPGRTDGIVLGVEEALIRPAGLSPAEWHEDDPVPRLR